MPEESRDYLILGNPPSIDIDILRMLLQSSTASVDTARSQTSVIKKVASKSYSCLVLTAADSSDPVVTEIGPGIDQRPLIVLVSGIRRSLPDWIVRDQDVHILHYDPNDLKQVVRQIRSIATTSEWKTDLERHTTLQNTISESISSYQSVDSREELERITCTRLVASDLYETAWTSIVEQDELVPHITSGISTQHLASIPTSDVSEIDVTDDSHSITIPLRHDDLIGTLTLTTSHEIDDAERELLRDFGETLSIAIQQLEEEDSSRNIALEIYTRSLSHELRNHLQSAKAELQADSDPARVSAILDRIERLDREVILLIKDSIEEERSVHSLSEIVEDVQKRMPEIEDRVSIVDSTSVRVCRPLLELLFENLFRNTRDHAGAGAQIRVGTLDDGFFVEDTGKGLPDTGSLFNWRESVNGNSGTGLAIIDRIVELHEWDIDSTESAEGGARFEFTTDQLALKYHGI